MTRYQSYEGESLGDALARRFHNTPLKPLVEKPVLSQRLPGADERQSCAAPLGVV